MSELNTLDEAWSSALCVVAHPDDLEFGSAAAIARWTSQGKDVRYVMVTSGEAGIDALAPDEAKVVREGEQVASAKVVGVEVVEFLGQPDGVLEYGVELRRVICAAIRRHRPEIVLTGNFAPTFEGGALNQADHIAVGRAVLDAVRDAGNRWVFHDQVAEGSEPWGGVRQVWAAGSPTPTHAVDITETFDRGVESLKAHRAYIDGLGWHFDPEEFLEGLGRQAGTRFGTPKATTFEVFDLARNDDPQDS